MPCITLHLINILLNVYNITHMRHRMQTQTITFCLHIRNDTLDSQLGVMIKISFTPFSDPPPCRHSPLLLSLSLFFSLLILIPHVPHHHLFTFPPFIFLPRRNLKSILDNNQLAITSLVWNSHALN